MRAWGWGWTLAAAFGAASVGAAVAGGCGGSAGESNTSSGGGSTPDGGVEVILDGGGTIPKPPNGEKACPQSPCNYQSNQGCSAGDSCVPLLNPDDTVTPACEPAGSGKSGANCADNAACAPGYVCIGKTCHKLCCGGDWSGCDTKTEHCFRALEYGLPDGGAVQTGAMICDAIDTCDPLVPSSCNELGFTCQLVDPTGAAACAPEGTGDEGQPCPCKGGFLCVDNACRRLCKAVEGGAEPFCQQGEGVCVHFNRDPDGVGECTP
ncbi:MAG TPA: hypothetical protein VHB21_20685 [Minicystis sp.]|nr:hypothetical protein [Minicystis sp.]